MSMAATPSTGLRRPWWCGSLARRLAVALGLALLVGYPLDLLTNGGRLGVSVRATELGAVGVAAFSLFERLPCRLPRWLARWVLQVLAVGVVMAPADLVLTLLDQAPGAPAPWATSEGLGELGASIALAVLIGPWTALAALIRQKDALARHLSLTHALERAELEREALRARLSQLQAQVVPHFLFNTLANIQALVDAGSFRASPVLRSLTAYLRAAVPRLDADEGTLDDEVRTTEAYLELMHMRMPDRLDYAVRVDEAARGLGCPPTALLTLVENAVRHGIDPSEAGGRIEVDVERRGDRCFLRVVDTGAGLALGSEGLGTGLATLRERLRLDFGGDARLRVEANAPSGVRAELDLPARTLAP